jgi:hypothetical protein
MQREPILRKILERISLNLQNSCWWRLMNDVRTSLLELYDTAYINGF